MKITFRASRKQRCMIACVKIGTWKNAPCVRVEVTKRLRTKELIDNMTAAIEPVIKRTEESFFDAETKLERNMVIDEARMQIASILRRLCAGCRYYKWDERIVTYTRWRNNEERLNEHVKIVHHSAILPIAWVEKYGSARAAYAHRYAEQFAYPLYLA